MGKNKIRINSEWEIMFEIIDKKYLRIISDCDLSIFPENTSTITLMGGEENMRTKWCPVCIKKDELNELTRLWDDDKPAYHCDECGNFFDFNLEKVKKE